MNLQGKFPPSAEAAATADCRSLAAVVGTVDKKPMRGGSCDGYDKLP